MRITITTGRMDGDVGGPILAARDLLERLEAFVTAHTSLQVLGLGWTMRDYAELLNTGVCKKIVRGPNGLEEVEIKLEYNVTKEPQA